MYILSTPPSPPKKEKRKKEASGKVLVNRICVHFNVYTQPHPPRGNKRWLQKELQTDNCGVLRSQCILPDLLCLNPCIDTQMKITFGFVCIHRWTEWGPLRLTDRWQQIRSRAPHTCSHAGWWCYCWVSHIRYQAPKELSGTQEVLPAAGRHIRAKRAERRREEGWWGHWAPRIQPCGQPS